MLQPDASTDILRRLNTVIIITFSIQHLSKHSESKEHKLLCSINSSLFPLRNTSIIIVMPILLMKGSAEKWPFGPSVTVFHGFHARPSELGQIVWQVGYPAPPVLCSSLL